MEASHALLRKSVVCRHILCSVLRAFAVADSFEGLLPYLPCQFVRFRCPLLDSNRVTTLFEYRDCAVPYRSAVVRLNSAPVRYDSEAHREAVPFLGGDARLSGGTAGHRP